MHLTRITLALAVAALAAAPTAASGAAELKSPQGADYTLNYWNLKGLRIHDGEADRSDVAGEWYQASSGGMSTAINNKGGFTNYDVPTNWIHRHRCVELVPDSVDAYGPWVYPS